MSSNSLGSTCSASIYSLGLICPALNRNWCVGMENSGFVNSRIDGIKKSSIFWLARITEESFLRTRFMQLRRYSIVVIFERKRYSSSTDAAVLPLPSSSLLMKERILNSIQSFKRRLVSISPFTPNTRKLESVMLVCPLKYLLSEPTHMEWMPRQTSWSVSSV